jgi:hypothetical protein
MDARYTRDAADILAAQQLIADIPAAQYIAKLHMAAGTGTLCGSRAKAVNITPKASKVTCARCLSAMAKAEKLKAAA